MEVGVLSLTPQGAVALGEITALSLDVYGTLLDLEAVAWRTVSGICALGGVPADIEIWRRASADMVAQFRALEGQGDGAGGSLWSPGAATAVAPGGGSPHPVTVGLAPGPSGSGPASRGLPFRNVRWMFERAYARVLPAFGLADVDLGRAVDLVMQGHAQAPPYAETRSFLQLVATVFDLCVASDADTALLDEALSNSGLGGLLPRRVSSEMVAAYKVEPDGGFFQAVLDLLGRHPGEVAHVGDGESDVVGSKRAGLVSVWVSRDGRRWGRDDVLPDVTVVDLAELAALLTLGESATG